MRGGGTFVLAGMLLASLWAPACAQTYKPPRAADGHPDFSGVWVTAFLTDIEPPKGVTKITVTPDEAKAILAKLDAAAKQDEKDGKPDVNDPDFTFYRYRNFAVVKGEIRTAMIVDPPDGMLPLSKEGAALNKLAEDSFEKGYDDPEEADASLRCLTGMTQAPIRAIPFYLPYLLVQTKDALVLQTEDVAAFRPIYFHRAPPPDAVRSFDGYSAGHWEGDTLVVVTDHLREDDHYRGALSDDAIIVGGGSRIIERFTRVSDAELFYQFTVEDPKYYSRPFHAEFSFTRKDDQVHEYACHEANYSLENALKARRMADIRAEAAKGELAAQSAQPKPKQPARRSKTTANSKP